MAVSNQKWLRQMKNLGMMLKSERKFDEIYRNSETYTFICTKSVLMYIIVYIWNCFTKNPSLSCYQKTL